MPSDENQALGPKRGQLEGSGGSDLAEAFKVLNLHLPRVLGARSVAPRSLLTAPGAAGIQSAAAPESAVFQALVKALLGGGGFSGAAGSPADAGVAVPFIPDYAPRVTPGEGEERRRRDETAAFPIGTPGPGERLSGLSDAEPAFGRRRN